MGKIFKIFNNGGNLNEEEFKMTKKLRTKLDEKALSVSIGELTYGLGRLPTVLVIK